MGPTSAVIGGTVVITGISVLKDVHKGHPPIKPIVMGFMLGSALLLLEFFSPPLAKSLALLGIVGALVTNGPDALAILGKVGT